MTVNYMQSYYGTIYRSEKRIRFQTFGDLCQTFLIGRLFLMTDFHNIEIKLKAEGMESFKLIYIFRSWEMLIS